MKGLADATWLRPTRALRSTFVPAAKRRGWRSVVSALFPMPPRRTDCDEALRRWLAHACRWKSARGQKRSRTGRCRPLRGNPAGARKASAEDGGPNDRRNHRPQDRERGIATLESEVLGEQAVSRHVLEQS